MFCSFVTYWAKCCARAFWKKSNGDNTELCTVWFTLLRRLRTLRPRYPPIPLLKPTLEHTSVCFPLPNTPSPFFGHSWCFIWRVLGASKLFWPRAGRMHHVLWIEFWNPVKRRPMVNRARKPEIGCKAVRSVPNHTQPELSPSHLPARA